MITIVTILSITICFEIYSTNVKIKALKKEIKNSDKAHKETIKSLLKKQENLEQKYNSIERIHENFLNAAYNYDKRLSSLDKHLEQYRNGIDARINKAEVKTRNLEIILTRQENINPTENKELSFQENTDYFNLIENQETRFASNYGWSIASNFELDLVNSLRDNPFMPFDGTTTLYKSNWDNPPTPTELLEKSQITEIGDVADLLEWEN